MIFLHGFWHGAETPLLLCGKGLKPSWSSTWKGKRSVWSLELILWPWAHSEIQGLDLTVSRLGGRKSHEMQAGEPTSPSLYAPSLSHSSLTPITQTIARGRNCYTNVVAVNASGRLTKGHLLLKFLIVLKPSPLVGNPFHDSFKHVDC